MYLLISIIQIFGRSKYFPFILWVFNLSFLLCNRVYEGYSFASFGLVSLLYLITSFFIIYNNLFLKFSDSWAYLDKFKGTFRWHICFNFGIILSLLLSISINFFIFSNNFLLFFSHSCFTHDKLWV